MTDPYKGFSSLTTQPERWAAVVPSDTVDFAELPKALFISVAGNIVLVGSDGVAETFPVTAGQYLNVRPKRVNALNTTATAIALY